MTVLDLLIYVVASFGLAYIVGHSKLSLPIRYWIEPSRAVSRWSALDYIRHVGLALVECPACLGFWTGAIVGAAELWRMVSGPRWWCVVISGLFTAGSNFLLGAFSGLIRAEAQEDD